MGKGAFTGKLLERGDVRCGGLQNFNHFVYVDESIFTVYSIRDGQNDARALYIAGGILTF